MTRPPGRAARIVTLVALPLLCGASLSGCPFMFMEPLDDPNDDFSVSLPLSWPLRDLDDGRTHVPLDESLSLRGVHWDVLPPEPQTMEGVETLPWLALLRAEDGSPHPFELEILSIEGGTVDIHPVGGLDPDTDYVLVFPTCSFQPHVSCPDPVDFSTRSAPHVQSVWRANDSLLVVFSEAMDPETLTLGHGAVDLVFEQGGETYTVVTDLNLADFVWGTTGRVFSVASISEIPFSIVLGPDIRAASSAHLDVDGDGGADEGLSFVHHVFPTELEVCLTREDYPQPCVSEAATDGGLLTYFAPIDVDLVVP